MSDSAISEHILSGHAVNLNTLQKHFSQGFLLGSEPNPLIAMLGATSALHLSNWHEKMRVL